METWREEEIGEGGIAEVGADVEGETEEVKGAGKVGIILADNTSF